MLRAVDDAVAELAEGFQLARRSLVPLAVSARREFVDDLLTGGADVVGLLDRASGFGLHLSGPHAVAVVTAAREFTDDNPWCAPSNVPFWVARVTPMRWSPARAANWWSFSRRRIAMPSTTCWQGFGRLSGRGPMTTGECSCSGVLWTARGRSLSGRPRTTASGVVASYREALDALDLAQRLSLTAPIIDARDLLVYRVLVNDRPAVTDLIHTLLTPLLEARGGAGPMIDTLLAYFSAGGNTAKTARDLHLSVRAVTYRLDRIRELTGQNVNDPNDSFALHAAVLGAKLLDWPATELT